MKIGIVIHMAEIREIGRAFTFREMKNCAVQAEKAGFDSVWLYDHFLYREQPDETIGIWESWSVLSAIAAVTRRVELGTLVACTQYRNPALLAKMAHTVDEISGGRLILGLGAGWNKPEFDSFGYPFDHKVDRFEEALQIIRPLLNEGRCDFNGKYYQAKDCEIRPRGPRAHIPLMIGSFGPRTMKLTAQYADLWNTCYLARPEQLDERAAEIDKACAEAGRDPASLGKTVLGYAGFPEIFDLSKFPDEIIHGTPEEIAAVFQGFAQKGVQHMMLHLIPSIPRAIRRLAAALEVYRRAEPAPAHP